MCCFMFSYLHTLLNKGKLNAIETVELARQVIHRQQVRGAAPCSGGRQAQRRV